MYGDCSFYKSYFGQLRAICENGTWKTIGNCIEYSKPLEVQGVRLVNGSNPAEGRVEMKVFDTWGTVCSDDFGMKEAEVICRMMGYLHAKSVAVKGSYGIGTGPIFIDDLNCGDDASHINDCEYTTYHNCSHEHDVSVICTGQNRQKQLSMKHFLTQQGQYDPTTTVLSIMPQPMSIVQIPAPEYQSRKEIEHYRSNCPRKIKITCQVLWTIVDYHTRSRMK
ncbi:deleted in malignant brain tumors 1 protein-like [Dreissena polymorpha]|uniref:deleted in malignant brain tumors 1 protein-like n=1 Tax=Dreissena polymorpha TaxID=45954 RepID=UPI0022647AFB|nr:deleted in malignant brain tumors 1 protein-like [Dreissena polymorpha]